MTISVSRQEFYAVLLDTLSEEETKTVCSLRLGIDYDSLPGDGKAAKQRELMAYLERRERNGELIAAVAQERPRALKFQTGPLGSLLRVNDEMPDPAHLNEFLASLGQLVIINQYAARLLLLAVAILMFVTVAAYVLIAF